MVDKIMWLLSVETDGFSSVVCLAPHSEHLDLNLLKWKCVVQMESLLASINKEFLGDQKTT